MKKPKFGSCGYKDHGYVSEAENDYVLLRDWDHQDEKTGTELRRDILREVESCVCRDRQNTYGDAEDNFADIAKIASVVLAPYLHKDLDAKAVALFSAAIKMARLRTSPEHLDNWIDLAGYAVCGAGIVKRGAK